MAIYTQAAAVQPVASQPAKTGQTLCRQAFQANRHQKLSVVQSIVLLLKIIPAWQ